MTAPDLLHEFLVRTAATWPDRTAVDVPPAPDRPDRQVVTYAQLDEWSDGLAERLQALVTGECVVAILLPRTAAAFAAQLAVLKTGAAYTCIDPDFPDERARWILEDARAIALVTDTHGVARANRAGWTTVPTLDVSGVSRTPLTPVRAPRPSPAWLTPSHLAYLIYTSGTTGQPKGVAVEHRSIVNLVADDHREFGLTPADRVGQSSSTAYDSSIEETWLAFAAGATLVVIDDEAARSGPDLIPWLQRERITVLCPPPTLLRATGCLNPDSALPDLKLLYVGGEALPRDVADRWARGRRLVNGYGPTECSVTAIRGDIHEGEPITIGRPVQNIVACVLNELLEEAPEGERGELCLGGAGLARGYWQRPDLTVTRFIDHPRFGRLYRTGDLAHRDATGQWFCHGRLDSQVKIRGYRIELDEVETCLLSCPGVRAAACAAQTSGTQTTLVAFVVADDPARPPEADALRAALRRVLPSYMVPARIGFLAQLPTTVGGKLNRAALPMLAPARPGETNDRATPSTAAEIALEAAFRSVLHLDHPVSVDDDFFNDLGGDSLATALLVTRLREDRTTAWIAVRDVYDARTIAELARRTPAAEIADAPSVPAAGHTPRGRPVAATWVQFAWLLAGQSVAAVAGYALVFIALPWLAHTLTLVGVLLLAPVLGMAAVACYTPLAVLFAVTMKRLLIGRYRPQRTAVWSALYVRHWMVVASARLVPWRLLQGTTGQLAVLRALGAHVGKRVHIHRGVDLANGGWDLLHIGDDVTIGQDVSIGLVELDRGQLVIGFVTLGDGVTIDVRAGLGGDTVLEPNAHLTALSSLPPGTRIPAGQRWDGIPAAFAGPTLAPPVVDRTAREWSPFSHGLALMAARQAIVALTTLPFAGFAIVLCLGEGVDADRLQRWLISPPDRPMPWLEFLVVLTLLVPLRLGIQASLARLLGRVRPGVVSRWSASYIRIWLKTGLLHSAGEWLSGTLFWPVWLRAAGMAVGTGCEISTITDVVPELVTIGSDVFLADGIYLGGPRVHRGTVTLARTRLADRTFLGNHVVIAAGQDLPSDILLGVCTVADDRLMRAHSSWFGHPPFELPRREVVAADRRVTHDPGPIRYSNRVFWELLRFALPIVPVLTLLGWLRVIAAADAVTSQLLLLAVIVPATTLGAAALLCAVVLLLKWVLLGRVRPGQHPLWSCWCSRWDFHYVAWGRYASALLSALEGTLLLQWYLRAMGMTIGKRVVLGRGFAQVVDPDMIAIGDEATVSANFQAHTFEDRVLKIDRIHIGSQATLGSGSVPLYGADIGEGASVAPNSVVMKHERLTPGLRYEGAPTRTRRADEPLT